MRTTKVGVFEHIFSHEVLKREPVVGDLFWSKSRKSAFQVSKVVPVRPIGFRLVGVRVNIKNIPVDVEPKPWPRKTRPMLRAQIEIKRKPYPIASAKETQAATRKRIIALKHDETEHRLKTGTAVTATWRDPDDTNPRRREAKQVHNIKARDQVEYLVDNGIIGKSQGVAARKFRADYERGEIGMQAAKQLGMPPGGFGPSDGPTPTRVRYLIAWQATAAVVGKDALPLLIDVIISGKSFSQIARASNKQRSLTRLIYTAAGVLIATLDRLGEHYEAIEEAARRRREAEEREVSIPAGRNEADDNAGRHALHSRQSAG
jgi:hypothetical protein